MNHAIPPLPRRFVEMDAGYAPGQERSATPAGVPTVDFGHGDVSAFPPHEHTLRAVSEALQDGGSWAYSPYRGHDFIREPLAHRLSAWTGAEVDPASELIVTPGTQGGLFLALSSLIERGQRVAIVAPDYFANRKIVRYLEAEIVEIPLDLSAPGAPLDLAALEAAFRSGVRLLLFSNPNNPTGKVFDEAELAGIMALATAHDAHVVIDSLYARQMYDDRSYTHLRSLDPDGDRVTTLLGPSKTESVSGCRVGVAVGPGWLIDRMEALQGIVSLRAAGYTQAALSAWLDEPEGWLEERTLAHARIRDDLFTLFDGGGVPARLTEGGSYLFADISASGLEASIFVSELRRRTGVTVTRGTEFGDFPGHVRLNFSQDHSAATRAIEQLVAFVQDPS